MATLAALDATAIAVVLTAALLAGFTTAFAGFGTGLVASGLWLHVLPAATVPPLVALASVAAQIIGFIGARRAFDWPAASPLLAGGAAGVPVGVAALTLASPELLRGLVGGCLVAYAAYQLAGRRSLAIGERGGPAADGLVGFGGGCLGGFAGLSGPLPLVWLKLRGRHPDAQRATLQPFNLVVLALSCLIMAAAGRMNADVLAIALLALPATLAGAWAGARAYTGIRPATFQRVILGLLGASGLLLLGQVLVR